MHSEDPIASFLNSLKNQHNAKLDELFPSYSSSQNKSPKKKPKNPSKEKTSRMEGKTPFDWENENYDDSDDNLSSLETSFNKSKSFYSEMEESGISNEGFQYDMKPTKLTKADEVENGTESKGSSSKEKNDKPTKKPTKIKKLSKQPLEKETHPQSLIDEKQGQNKSKRTKNIKSDASTSSTIVSGSLNSSTEATSEELKSYLERTISESIWENTLNPTTIKSHLIETDNSLSRDIDFECPVRLVSSDTAVMERHNRSPLRSTPKPKKADIHQNDKYSMMEDQTTHLNGSEILQSSLHKSHRIKRRNKPIPSDETELSVLSTSESKNETRTIDKNSDSIKRTRKKPYHSETKLNNDSENIVASEEIGSVQSEDNILKNHRSKRKPKKPNISETSFGSETVDNTTSYSTEQPAYSSSLPSVPNDGESQKTLPETEETIMSTETTDSNLKAVKSKKHKKETKEEVEPGTSKETTKVKKKKKSKVESDKSEPLPVLGIKIHKVDGLKMNIYISHPVVRVHIYDIITGNYVTKQEKTRPVSSFYESDSIEIVLPMMTQPFDMKQQKSLIPHWEELLIFNEDYQYFLQENPKVLVFFEILDFLTMNQAVKKYHKLKQDGGWYKIAWAFLKLVGANNICNTEQRLRLQLYHPPKSILNLWNSKTVRTNVYDWWAKGDWKKYPSTLYVSVLPITLPSSVNPSLRSMIAVQEEKGYMSMEDLDRTLQGRPPLSENQNKTVTATESSLWLRLPGQTCQIPTDVHLSLQTSGSGCFVAKFCNSGRYLACALADDSGFPIAVYKIPSGELSGKLRGHSGLVYNLAWSPDNKLLLSSSADCTVRLWNVDSFAINQFLPHPSYVYSSKFHPRMTSVIVSGCYDHIVRAWQVDITGNKKIQLLQELEGHHSFVNAICFDEFGDKLFTGDGLGVIHIWNVYVSVHRKHSGVLQDWTLYRTVHCDFPERAPINDIWLHPKGRRIFVSCRNSSIFLLDAREFSLLQRYQDFSNRYSHIHPTVTPCGSYVISGSEDGTIYVWNCDTGQVVLHLLDLPYQKTVTTVDFHPFDHMFVCCAFGEGMPILIYQYTETALELQTSASLARSLIEKQSFTETPLSQTDVPVPKPSSSILKLPHASESDSDHPPLETLHKKNKKSSKGKTHSSEIFNDKIRTVTFRDDILPQSPQWKGILDKLDSVLDSSQLKNQAIAKSSSTNTELSSPSLLSFEPKPSTSRTSSTSTKSGNSKSSSQVVALYNYEAISSQELKLFPGMVIDVLRKSHPYWWTGRSVTDGREGQFPSNYVVPLDESSDPKEILSNAEEQLANSGTFQRTHAIMSDSGKLMFISASEDEGLESTSDLSRVRRRMKKEMLRSKK